MKHLTSLLNGAQFEFQFHFISMVPLTHSVDYITLHIHVSLEC